MPARPLSFGNLPVPSAQDHAQVLEQLLAAEQDIVPEVRAATGG